MAYWATHLLPRATSDTHTADDFAVFFKAQSTPFEHLPPRRQWTTCHAGLRRLRRNGAPWLTMKSSQEAHWFTIEQDVSVRSGSNFADQRYVRTAATLLFLAVQHIPYHWLFPARVQGRCRSTASGEKRAWCQRAEELQTCIELTICLQIAGECCSNSYPDLFRQQRIAGKDAVRESAFPQHRTGSNESVQRPVVGSGWRQDLSSVFARLHRRLRHGWLSILLFLLHFEGRFGLRGVVLEWFGS